MIDLTGMFQQLWERRWWLVLAALFGVSMAGVVGLAMTPVYRATVVLIPARGDSAGLEASMGSLPGSLGSLVGMSGLLNGAAEQRIEEALAVLRSRLFTERFIEEQSLVADLLSRRDGFPSTRWLRQGGRPPTAAEAVRVFNETVRIVSQDRKTNFVTLHIDWTDRERAAALANAQVDMLNSEMRSRAIAKIDATLRHLQQELVNTDVVETRNAINRLVQAQINQRMLADVTPDYSFRVVSEAMVPDWEDRIRPRLAYLMVVGGIAGAAIGILAALFAPSRRMMSRMS
jgi:uncharacterized protein involved in exopolysaccharide biosynthesis